MRRGDPPHRKDMSMFKSGQKVRIRPRTMGDMWGYCYFPGYDFGGDFVVKGYWPIEPETGEAVLYLHKPSSSMHVSGTGSVTSEAIHGLVEIGPALEGVKSRDRVATVIEWQKPGKSWRKSRDKIWEKGRKVSGEKRSLR